MCLMKCENWQTLTISTGHKHLNAPSQQKYDLSQQNSPATLKMSISSLFEFHIVTKGIDVIMYLASDVLN